MGVWALVVGSSFPLVNALSPNLPMLLITGIRFLVAALVIMPFMPTVAWTRPNVLSVLLYLSMGACQAVFFVCMLWAAPTTSSLVMSSLYVTVPVMAYFLGLKLRLAPPEHGLLTILITGAAGALLIAWATPMNINGYSLTGAWIYSIGCVAAAIHPVLSKWGLNRELLSASAANRTMYSLITGALLTLLAGIVIEPVTMLKHIELVDIGIILYLGIFSTALTFWLTQLATQSLIPAEVKGYSYLVPLVSLGMLLLFGKTEMDWMLLPGVLIVLSSIILLQIRSIRTRRISRNVSHEYSQPIPIRRERSEIRTKYFDLMSTWNSKF